MHPTLDRDALEALVDRIFRRRLAELVRESFEEAERQAVQDPPPRGLYPGPEGR